MEQPRDRVGVFLCLPDGSHDGEEGRGAPAKGGQGEEGAGMELDRGARRVIGLGAISLAVLPNSDDQSPASAYLQPSQAAPSTSVRLLDLYPN